MDVYFRQIANAKRESSISAGESKLDCVRRHIKTSERRIGRERELHLPEYLACAATHFTNCPGHNPVQRQHLQHLQGEE